MENNTPALIPIRAFVSPDVHAQLKANRRNRGVSITFAVQEALAAYLAKDSRSQGKRPKQPA